jgi:hypothetical protein
MSVFDAARRAVLPDRGVAADEMNSSTLEGSAKVRLPCVRKRHSGDGGHQIDSVRIDAELNDSVFGSEVIEHYANVAESELAQSRHVARLSRKPVPGDGKRTHDQEFNVVRA